MKYFTKEWYERCQKTSFHLLLEEDQQAETFSEQYFQQLYSNELTNWLTLQQEVASIMQNNAADQYNDHVPFNRESEIEQFHRSLTNNEMYVQKELPEALLKEIADIRVFALNKATRSVIKAVTEFCEDHERFVTATTEKYKKYMEEVSK